MRDTSASISPLQAVDGVRPWRHIKVCGFLLSMIVYCAPLTRAQTAPLTEVAVVTPNDAIPVAPSQQAKVRPFPSYGKVSLNCAATLSRTQTEPRSLCASGHPLLQVTTRSVLALAGKQVDLPANAPKQWLTNGSDEADDQSLSSRDLKYYGGRTPLIGKAIVRIAEQADSHPKITRVLLMIDPQF